MIDTWLSASLAEAAATLGDGYAEAFEQAPPWRFAWCDDDHWTAGALAASVDAVGRRFPILLGLATVEAEITDAAERMEALLYRALAENWTADRLLAAAQGEKPEATSQWRAGEGWWTLGAEGSIDAQLVGARPAGLMLAMLSRDHGSG